MQVTPRIEYSRVYACSAARSGTGATGVDRSHQNLLLAYRSTALSTCSATMAMPQR